ncbi:MAG: RNA polymerase factor sigma-54 [Gammaproteobacteria bacterium]|nr:MAG: RNA polymerase factor sigma-54 [Gammaproteobacteria bacterium]
MKASLQLKLGQQLTMTPQLQQAIRLLQLSTLDLQQEIQEALDSNLMLETEDDHSLQANETELASAKSSVDQSGNSHEQPDANSDTPSPDNETTQLTDEPDFAPGEEWSAESIPDDLPVDTAWDDIYQSAPTQVATSSDDDMDYDSRNSAGETLQDHLYWQLNLTPMTETDNAIAMAIIDSIGLDGYLSVSVEEIHAGLAEELADLDLDEVTAVLKRIQHFDPPGVASRNLQECLLIQLDQLPQEEPWLPQAKLVVSHYLTQLGNKDYAQLMRRSRLKEETLKSVMQLIQSLNPRPGEAISNVKPEYIVPDIIVKKENGRWKIELNAEVSPKIRVNQNYASMVKRADSSADNVFLKDQLQEARWFIKSLQSRNETLLKVATKIVEYQQGFFDYGEEAMKPMVLHDIATAVDMHESTISRVTTQKYMHTPRGIFELKYFFSSHVATTEGGECSSTAIRAIIKKLVAAEAAKKPLSDSKIASLLGEQGIKVARRTIAKYREAMSIPPSNERKRLL